MTEKGWKYKIGDHVVWIGDDERRRGARGVITGRVAIMRTNPGYDVQWKYGPFPVYEHSLKLVPALELLAEAAE